MGNRKIIYFNNKKTTFEGHKIEEIILYFHVKFCFDFNQNERVKD